MVLKPKSLRSRHKQTQCLWKPTPWSLDGHFSRKSPCGRGKGALWCLFIRDPITLTRTAPDLPNHPLKAPSPDPITLGIRISYGILGDTNIHPTASTVLQRGHYRRNSPITEVKAQATEYSKYVIRSSYISVYLCVAAGERIVCSNYYHVTSN